jgi:hypothetical protein
MLLSVGILALLIWKTPRRLRSNAGLLVLIGFLVTSTLAFSEMWWARFAPQLWMIPVIVGIVGLRTMRRGRRRLVPVALLVILCVNTVMVLYPYVSYSFRQSAAVARELAILRSRGEPIPIKFNRFPGTRHRFERENIPYVELATLPCPSSSRKKLQSSQAQICMR